MAQNKQSIRYKYGMCMNDDCPKCTAKEVQKKTLREEFICSECGQELRDCPAPKQFNPKPIIFAAVGVIVVALLAVGGVFLSKQQKAKAADEAEKQRVAQIEKTRQDSIQAAETARLEAEQAAREAEIAAEEAAKAEQERLLQEKEVEEAKRLAANSKKQSASTSTGSVDYGKWSGSWKSGKPHGTGTMRYTKEHLIDSRDPQKRVAKTGDYIIGEFANGKLVQGTWYDSSNNVKGSVIIGM